MNYQRPSTKKSIRTTNPNAVAQANRTLKQLYWNEGIRACEFCQWTAPPGLLGFATCLRIHHVLPLFAGGPLKERQNTALLCPNHSAMADALAFQSLTAQGNFCGPKTRDEMFLALRHLEEKRNQPLIFSQAPSAMEGLKAD